MLKPVGGSLSRHAALLLILLVIIAGVASTLRAASSPDLTVDSVWLERASPPGQVVTQVMPGEQFNIVAEVKNIGNAPASGYYVDAYYDAYYGRGGPDSVDAGQAQLWYVGPITAQVGSHTTQWVADPDNKIIEMSESNNALTYTFVIGSQNATTTVTSSMTSSTSTTTLSSGSTSSTTPAFISEVSALVFNTSAVTYFIGTTNPYDNQALLGAWGLKSGQLSTAQLGPCTRSDWVDQSTGKPLVAGGLLLVAGPLANRVVNYYASQGLSAGFRFSNGYAQIVYRGQVIGQMPEGNIGKGKDLFIAQTFKDGDRSVFVIWGIGAQGTLASGVWLISNFSQLASLNHSTYVYGWTDSNGDSYPQSNEISPVYQGD